MIIESQYNRYDVSSCGIRSERKWYVIKDSEGVWITQTPHEGDDILFESPDLSAAEAQLYRLSDWD